MVQAAMSSPIIQEMVQALIVEIGKMTIDQFTQLPKNFEKRGKVHELIHEHEITSLMMYSYVNELLDPEVNNAFIDHIFVQLDKKMHQLKSINEQIALLQRS